MTNQDPLSSRTRSKVREIQTRATRNAWLKAIHQAGLIDFSTKSARLADKLFIARELKNYLGPAYQKFHPKTSGLKEFVQKLGLRQKLEAYDRTPREDLRLELHTKLDRALAAEFPSGFIVKPTLTLSSEGKAPGFYFSKEQFLGAFLQVEPNHYRHHVAYDTPFYSEIVEMVVSGEELMLQENVFTAAGYPEESETKVYDEIRIHTFEDKIVAGATFSRWAAKEIRDARKFHHAETFIQEFLDLLPRQFLAGQAWGLDVFVFDNFQTRIVDINTNRGQPAAQWSGYLPRPRVLGAYTRHIEAKKAVRFSGWNGFLLRHDMGNVLKNWKKRYLQGIR